MISQKKLIDLAPVIEPALGDWIHGESLALQQISFIFFILDDTDHRCIVPALIAPRGYGTHLFQLPGNYMGTHTFDITLEDILNDLRFFFIDRDFLGLRIVVISKSTGKAHDLAAGHLHCQSLLDVGRDILNFLLGYGADSLKIYAPAERLAIIKNARAMSSLYIEEICSKAEHDITHFWQTGEVLSDTGYAAIAGITAGESANYKLQKVETGNPDLRVVEFTAADGRKWQFAANFGTGSAVWQNRLLPAGECGLLNGK